MTEIASHSAVRAEDQGTQVRAVRPHQDDAMTALDETFAEHSRAQLVMACGTGKTLVGRWYAERIDAALTVVILPTLTLVAQTLQEWRSDRGWPFDAVVTCSDPSTADGVQERNHDDEDEVSLPFWATMRARVTTDARVVARKLAEGRATHQPVVVFSTYHSAHVVASAVRRARAHVDLVLADEAHYLAGRPRPEVRVVVNDDLPARLRLFMTATPVLNTTTTREAEPWDTAEALSMDNQAVFGPVAYQLGFGEAIHRKLLTDYQVCIYETPGQGDRPDPTAALIAAAERGVGSVLSFHSRVAKARAFASAVDGLQLPDGRVVVARAVAGSDSAATRAQALSLLGSRGPGQLVVVASARCLTAGVDIPSVDGVLFADPKESAVEIVQAVGRALRPAPGKDLGLIMIPVCVPEGLDDETALSTSSFGIVWRILRALRSMDSRLAAEFARRVQTDSSHRSPVDIALTSMDPRALCARIVDFLSPAWDQTFAELQEFAGRHGHSSPASSTRLGIWCVRQQRAYRLGNLEPDRAKRLASLPGWAWDRRVQRWRHQYDEIKQFANDNGGLDLGRGAIAETVLRWAEPVSMATSVGRWCAWHRQMHRRGELAEWQRDLLEQIPGWRWDLLDDDDAAAVDLLREYVAWKGHANPPADFVEDDIPLGRWINTIRRRNATGNLDRVLLDEITVVCPNSTHQGALRWYHAETRWLLGLEALRQFIAREGHCRIPGGHVEQLADYSVSLYAWYKLQRQYYAQGKLNAARARKLDAATSGQIREPVAPRERRLGVGTSRHVRAKQAGAADQWVDASRSWDLIRSLLSRGWTKAWIARELGLGNELCLHSDMVTADQAEAIATLSARVGERCAPPRRGLKPLPPLAEIVAAEGNSGAREVA